MTLDQLTTLRDALATAAILGATEIPPTYMTGILHALSWAKREAAAKEAA